MGKASTYPERKKAAMYSKIEKWQERAAGLLVILLLCVQPLYLNAERYISLTKHKFEFFVVCMICILVAVIIIWIARIARNPKLGPRERPYLADWAVLGFAIVTLLSTLFSPFKDAIRASTGVQVNLWTGVPEPDGRYDGAITQLLYVAAFFVIAHWYKPRVRHFALFGISASLIGLIGVLQFYGMDFLRLWPNDLPQYRVANFYNIFFRSTLGNVDIVSTYVCVAVLLCGFLFVKMSSKWQPLWLAASALNFWLMELANAYSGRVGVLVAMVLAIPFIVENMKVLGKALILASSWVAAYTLQKLFYNVLTLKNRAFDSLAPFIAICVILLAVGIFLTVRGKVSGRENPVRWKLGVLLIVVIIIAGIIGVETLGKRDENTGRKNLIADVRDVLHGDIRDELGTYRIYIWRNALAAYSEHPVIGTGPDTFGHAFPAQAQGKYGENYDKAHNEYIQILICQGILGFACYLVFLVSSSFSAVPKAFRNPMLMAVLAAFTGYCAQAFFNISLPIASQLLWVFAGMLANKNFREYSVGP